MTHSSVWATRGDVRYRLVGTEAVVVQQRQAEVMVLNEVGARILDLLAAKPTVTGLLDTLATEFDIDRKQLERDVCAFLEELSEAGIIEETRPQAEKMNDGI